MNELKDRDELSSACDGLNSLWKELETEFARIYMWFPTQIKMGDVPASLGWHKVKGEWRICLGKHGEIGGWDWRPILECPLEMRVQAVVHISAHRKELDRLRREFLPLVREAIRSLRGILEDLQ